MRMRMKIQGIKEFNDYRCLGHFILGEFSGYFEYPVYKLYSTADLMHMSQALEERSTHTR